MASITHPRTSPPPLECLALARTPARPVQLEDIGQALEDGGVPIDLAQLEAALRELGFVYGLLRYSDGNYRQTAPLLGRIAQARFWDSAEERERLIHKVRSESRLRTDARGFFHGVGFETYTLDGGFKATSTLPEYGLLGAARGIYVQLHTSNVLNVEDVRQAEENAKRVGKGQLADKVSFVVTSVPPQLEAYRSIAQLRQDEDFHIVLLTDANMRAARDNATSSQILLRSVRRALGRQNLFVLDEPATDILDFFGRSGILENIANDCQTGQVIGLMGMLDVGKTSLAWQILQHLPNAVAAWVDLPDHATSGIYHQVRQAWLADTQRKFPRWEQPQLDPLPKQPSLRQISADMTAIRDSLLEQTSTTGLVAIADELADFHVASADMLTLVKAVGSTENVSLLGVCGPSIRDVDSFQIVHTLRPFRRETSVEMITALAIQMGLEFEEDALEQLHGTSGGHPLILRQLAHLAQAGRASAEGLVTATHMNRAISAYPSQYDQTLRRLWDSLMEEERRAIRSAAGLRLSPTDEVAIRLADSGWLEEKDSQWRLFSPLVERWLSSELSS